MELGGTSAELSEGELVEEAENTDGPGGVEDGAEPERKKRKVHDSLSNPDGEWEKPSKRQLKKMASRKRKTKKQYQEKEDKFASTISLQKQANTSILNTCQTEVLESLVKIFRGEQSKISSIQKMKTSLFQQVVSHLVVGSSMPVFPIEGLVELRQDHRVVVVWLSMVSAEFFHSDCRHFPRLNKLTPCVRFDVQHPGSSSYARLGLEVFMMSADTDNHAAPFSSANGGVGKAVPPLWSYLLSLSDLTDNDFPNPTNGGVDQLGRNISDYFSVMEWPDCDIQDTAEVTAERELGKKEDVDKMPMFAIDCEMVQTQNGSELARISIVNEDIECVYDTYVKPDCPVIDYRSKYSGICEATLENVTTILGDVQKKLANVLSPNSILVGHSLENDFHAMKFRHPFVIDTSYLFTPQATPTCKPALRKLSKELLDTCIQNSENGHNSIEDATMCMKLVILKSKEGTKCKIPFNEITPSIFTDFRTNGCTTGIVDKESIIRLFGKGSSHTIDVKTDEEAVARSVEVIPLSKFTFVQLHGMEYLLKSDLQVSKEKQLEAALSLDQLVVDLVKGCPSKTIVFVTCGSSDIRKVRSLQQLEFADYNQLKKQVLVARTGSVVGFLVD